jgi:hypothetical protein
MKEVNEKTFVYVHEYSSKAKVCFKSNLPVRVRIAIDANIKMPEGLIET